MTRCRRAGSVVFCLLLAGIVAAPASGQAGTGHLEGYAGLYAPESDLLSDGATFGVRLGYQFGDSWGYLVQLGRYSTSDRLPLPGGPEVNLSLWIVDWSAVWAPTHGRRDGFMLLFGPGFALSDAEAAALADDRSVPAADTFTLHVAGAWSFPIANDFAVRPEVRARWFEASSTIDLEATVAFGWKF